MSPLRQSVADYLVVRRALGYKLERTEKLLAQFVTYLEDLGEERITTKHALAWATLPAGVDAWLSNRLSVVRGFATFMQTIDPATEVPASDLLPWRRCRATPYLYSDAQIVALIRAAVTLSTTHRVATYQTLIGALSVTGMRIGEAIGPNRSDFDGQAGLIVVRNAKFGKSRELPLHPSAVKALRRYLRRRDRPRASVCTEAMLVSTAGTRLLISSVQSTFRKLLGRAGIEPRSSLCRPRLHDLRRTFAVRTMIDGYRKKGEVGPRLALLSTYLGHVDPGKTYWYLSAAPELLKLAGDRLEQHLGDRR
jgi:integrase/recombinase XerD